MLGAMWLFVTGCEFGSERILYGLLWNKRADTAFFSGIRSDAPSGRSRGIPSRGINISYHLVTFIPEQF
jgi:hypothetical protein